VAAETTIVGPAQRQTDVTFRRDAKWPHLLVVSDAAFRPGNCSGAGEGRAGCQPGIEEFLKQEESKATAHIEVKA